MVSRFVGSILSRRKKRPCEPCPTGIHDGFIFAPEPSRVRVGYGDNYPAACRAASAALRLPLVFICFPLSLELPRTNLKHKSVLSLMRLNAAAESERFFASEVGHSGMR